MPRVDASSSRSLNLIAEPITADAFAPYGTLIEWPGGGEYGQAYELRRPINGGSSQRLDWPQALALTAAGGEPRLALFQAQARSFPFIATELEVHRLGSQTFAPLGVAADQAAYVVLVAKAAVSGQPDLGTLRAFSCRGDQAISLAAGSWHHALLAVREASFLVVERVAGALDEAVDCDIAHLPQPVVIGLQAKKGLQGA